MPASKSFAFQRVMRKDDRRRCSGKCALIGGKTMTAALRQQNDCALKPPTHRTLIDGVGKKRRTAAKCATLIAASCSNPLPLPSSRCPFTCAATAFRFSCVHLRCLLCVFCEKKSSVALFSSRKSLVVPFSD